MSYNNFFLNSIGQADTKSHYFMKTCKNAYEWLWWKKWVPFYPWYYMYSHSTTSHTSRTIVIEQKEEETWWDVRRRCSYNKPIHVSAISKHIRALTSLCNVRDEISPKCFTTHRSDCVELSAISFACTREKKVNMWRDFSLQVISLPAIKRQ